MPRSDARCGDRSARCTAREPFEEQVWLLIGIRGVTRCLGLVLDTYS
jgi:hypothetical protein